MRIRRVMLKYVNYDIVFQEIPDEMTLAINLSNCPNGCKGCHSPRLMEDIGEELSVEVLERLLARYGSSVTCVCLMGGDASPHDVFGLARFIKASSSLKTAWYSGRDMMPSDVDCFDYIKLGAYVERLGGLKSRTTNQRLYKRVDGETDVDITHLFWNH